MATVGSEGYNKDFGEGPKRRSIFDDVGDTFADIFLGGSSASKAKQRAEALKRDYEMYRESKRKQRAAFDSEYAALKSQSLYDVFLRQAPGAESKLNASQAILSIDDDKWGGDHNAILKQYSAMYKEMEGTGMLRYLSGTTKGRDSTILNSEALNTAQKTILGK